MQIETYLYQDKQWNKQFDTTLAINQNKISEKNLKERLLQIKRDLLSVYFNVA